MSNKAKFTMKNYYYIVHVLICISIMSCKTPAIGGQTNVNKQGKTLCKDMVWYSFIAGKPSNVHLERSQKVAQRWGFKIAYSLGSCTNNAEDKRKDSLSQEKSIPLFKCLTENVGENWETKFREEVAKEL